MKIFIKIKSAEPTNPVESVLKALTRKLHEVVEDPAAAELIVTDSTTDALGFLKDYEDAKVLIALQPGDRQRAEGGAKSLAKAYPGRVHIRPILENDGEENIVFFLMRSNPLEEVR